MQRGGPFLDLPPEGVEVSKEFVRTSKLLVHSCVPKKLPKTLHKSSQSLPKSPKIHPKSIPNRFERRLGDHLGPAPLNKSVLEFPKYQNDAKMEAKMESKSSKQTTKTSSKNAMISEGCFSWIWVISELILDQILSTFYHFSKK